jgi:oligopeptide/dipeptide ABC transporter ATP-binding protein
MTTTAEELTGPAPLLEVRGLVKQFAIRRGAFGTATVHAVAGVDLQVRQGEVLSLVGESGSGKSTLGACVTGLLAPTEGSVLYDGAEVSLSRSGRRAFRRRVQPIFQDPRSSLDPRWPIERTIKEPLDAYGVGTAAERATRVSELMDLVGLPRHLARRLPRELSGGQQQRVAIAAALALEPELLVADEPVSALDVSVQAQILNLLAELRSYLNLAMLFISHDLSVVEHLSDRVAVMYLGRIVETGGVDEIFTTPRHPYTQALIESIPHADPGRPMSRIRLLGEIPSPVNPPSGCRFHPRCPVAIERCATDQPSQTTFELDHLAACHVASLARRSEPIPNPFRNNEEHLT